MILTPKRKLVQYASPLAPLKYFQAKKDATIFFLNMLHALILIFVPKWLTYSCEQTLSDGKFYLLRKCFQKVVMKFFLLTLVLRNGTRSGKSLGIKEGVAGSNAKIYESE